MNKKNRTAIAITILITGLLFSFAGCNSTKEIPDDLTAPQLLQRGQASLDSSDYKAAERYFLKTIQQYGDDVNTYIEAKYELAHLYIKIKSYEKAYNTLSEILELYDYDMTGSLPPAYKKLAQIEMDKIPLAKLEEYQNASR
ncbi:MAG: tetratricopeptide repeat protein [Treponema sp.]|nr:tetratricopeptide repeat protein [Treponema sp.]